MKIRFIVASRLLLMLAVFIALFPCRARCGQGSQNVPAYGVAEPEKVIEELNRALRDELTAIAQYFVHAEMCANWGYQRVADLTQERAITEMRHAEGLIERILFLEGRPTMEFLEIRIGKSVKEQFEFDRRAETGASALYNRAIDVARQAGDNTSANLFEGNLQDEQEHLDWLDAQLHMIEEIGYERYLIFQMEDAEQGP